jgi:hypothetical protein
MKKRIYVAFITLSILGACNSDESETQKNLTAGIWYQEEHWLDEDGDGTLTLYPYLDNCNQDDEYRFEEDGAFKFNDGANLCEPGFPVSVAGNWELRENDGQLHLFFSSSTDAIDYEITEITENRLVLDRIFPDDPGATLPYEKLVLRR